MDQRIDTAWFDDQYNNRQRVPEAGVILAGWAQASARARSQLNAHIDLAYGESAAERLDIFLPRAARRGTGARRKVSGAPVLVFIHGGYWRSLDKSDHSHVAEGFTAEGHVVVVPNYALCPAVTMETIALQMARAVAWTWRHARDFGGDP